MEIPDGQLERQVEGPAPRRHSLVEKVFRRKSVADHLSLEFGKWTKENYNDDSHVGGSLNSNVKYRSSLHFLVHRLIESPIFSSVIFLTICANFFTLILEIEKPMPIGNRVYEHLDTCFMTIYTIEFVFKVYVQPVGYWKSNYNLLDFVVLALSYVTIVQNLMETDGVNITYFKVARGFRALRALRSINFIRSLRFIIIALLKTLTSATSLLMLLILLILIFAVTGLYFFGRGVNADKMYWGTIGKAMYSLWDYTTLDGWLMLQDSLDAHGFVYSKLFTILFVFVGKFIFTNLFIGVVIQNLEEAQDEERTVKEVKKSQLYKKKKEYILQKQMRDLEELLEDKAAVNKEVSFNEFLKSLAGKQSHDDIVPMKHLTCNQLWLETYLQTLNYQDKSLTNVQKLHMETLNTICEVVEHRMKVMFGDDPRSYDLNH